MRSTSPSAFTYESPVLAGETPLVVVRNGYSCKAVLNNSTGELYDLIADDPMFNEADQAKHLTHADAIPKGRAFEIFLPLAHELLLPEDEDVYEFKLVDMGEFASPPGSEKDLYLCQWWISHNFSYDGLPCRDRGSGRGILVCLSAFSGRITRVIHKPVVAPEDEELAVDADEALKAAAGWLAKQPYFSTEQNRETRFPEGTQSEAQLVVACPNGYPGATYSMQEQYAACSSYYCWEIPFEYRELANWFPAVVWVRAHTGEVIGGQDRPVEQQDEPH